MTRWLISHSHTNCLALKTICYNFTYYAQIMFKLYSSFPMFCCSYGHIATVSKYKHLQLTTMVLTISMEELDTTHSDLGILFDSQLKFLDHTTQVTTKANQVLGLIKKSFDYLESRSYHANTIVQYISSTYLRI